MRLDRLLVTRGVGSRKEVQAMIRKGRVTLNGGVNTRPESDCAEQPEVELDGRRLDTRLMRHVVMNKPGDVLTAARDRKQKTVMDLLPPEYASLECMPVGRLDRDTTGVLLFTCDGEMAHRLLSPRHHVEKVYAARIYGQLTEAEADRLRLGVDLGDFVSAPARVEVLEHGENDLVRLTISEGKFHQVKRMFESVGHTVLRLHREAFGPLRAEDLEEGAWRELSDGEIRALRACCGLD